MFSTIIIFTLVLFVLYLTGFYFFNDLQVRTRNDIAHDNVLLIYPHPDDEVFTAGGLTKKLSSLGKEVSLLVLTRGEKGTPDAHLENGLKKIRTKEVKKVGKIIGISNLILKDYPDGSLDKKKNDIKIEVKNKIKKLKPDLVITFDQTGLYGHPDHIAVSEVVTEVIENDESIKLWYATSPEKVLSIMNLPEHMAKNKNYKDLRKRPTHKVMMGVSGLKAKIRGIYSYQSQFESFPKSYPISWIPLWIYLLFKPFEYFHEVGSDNS